MRHIWDLIRYGLFYGFTWSIAVLPRPIFYGLSDIVAFVLGVVIRYRRQVVHTNLERSFPELPIKERRRIAMCFYKHLSDLILESFFLLHASPKRILKRCTYTNLEVLEPYYSQQRSVVIAAAHIANWEFLTSASAYIAHQQLNVYKPLHNKRLGRILTRSRERFGGTAVSMQNVLREIVRCQSAGIPFLIGLISDQTPPPDKHFWLEFLHQDTMVYSGVEKIARKFDLPVFFCNMHRVKRGYYSVHLDLITTQPEAEPENAITIRYMKLLEEVIHKHPESWLWSHRRWKRQRPQS